MNKPMKARNDLSKSTLLSLLIAGGTATSALAQGEIASGTLAYTGSGPYTYDLTFSDAAGATSAIGSVWYAWVPGQFFLPSAPSSALAPAGWTAHISGDSVQFVAGTSSADIAAGSSLSGFSYQATFTPAQLAAAPNSGESVAYAGGLFSDGGDTFTVSVSAVPEPSAAAMLALGTAGLFRAGLKRPRAARDIRMRKS